MNDNKTDWRNNLRMRPNAVSNTRRKITDTYRRAMPNRQQSPQNTQPEPVDSPQPPAKVTSPSPPRRPQSQPQPSGSPKAQPQNRGPEPYTSSPDINDSIADLYFSDIPSINKKKRKSDTTGLLRTHKKKLKIAAGIVGGAVLLFGAISLVNNIRGGSNNTTADHDGTNPNFTPLEPLDITAEDPDKNVAESGRYYDSQKKVLGYRTDFNGASLTISQQNLPMSFSENKHSEMKKVAKSIEATETIETIYGDAHIATDTNSKTQTAVFATDGLLVFVRANDTLAPDEWEYYINQLQPDS